MTAFIAARRSEFGVEPLCKVLQTGPVDLPRGAEAPPRRALRDVTLEGEIHRVHESNFAVYGAHKVWRQLNREGIVVARCTVERLMRKLGLRGVVRGKTHKTTID